MGLPPVVTGVDANVPSMYSCVHLNPVMQDSQVQHALMVDQLDWQSCAHTSVRVMCMLCLQLGNYSNVQYIKLVLVGQSHLTAINTCTNISSSFPRLIHLRPIWLRTSMEVRVSIPERWLVMVLMQELTSAHYDRVTELLTLLQKIWQHRVSSYSSERGRERKRESSSQHHSPLIPVVCLRMSWVNMHGTKYRDRGRLLMTS